VEQNRQSDKEEDQFGPESDIDVPIELHIEELFLRSLIVFCVGLFICLILFPVSEDVIEYLWNSHIPNPDSNRPVLYNPVSLFMTRIQVVSLFAIIVSFPIIIFQSYRFIEPGLYEIEKTYFKISSVSSILLSSIGILVSQFVVIPILFAYFSSYTQGAAEIAFGLEQTVGLMIIMSIYIVIIFQIPILIVLAVLMGLVSRDWLIRRRLIFWGSFFGLAFLSSPDPTGMAPIIIGILMLTLFEISIFALKYLPDSKRTSN
jgi:sec-independent protein translocase protein TatC